MQVKMPKDDLNYSWTIHSKQKIFQYGIGPNLVKRITRYHDRKEEGIAKKTIAVMKRRGKAESTKREIWVMYQLDGKKKKIISTWVYPGETKPGKKIEIPDDVWQELEKQK